MRTTSSSAAVAMRSLTGRDRDRRDRGRMIQRPQKLAGADVPHACGLAATADQDAAVGAELDRGDPAPVVEDPHAVAAPTSPASCRPVGTRGGDQLPVGREPRVEDGPLVDEGGKQPPRVGREDPRPPVLARDCDPGSVRAVLGRVDRTSRCAGRAVRVTRAGLRANTSSDSGVTAPGRPPRFRGAVQAPDRS